MCAGVQLVSRAKSLVLVSVAMLLVCHSWGAGDEGVGSLAEAERTLDRIAAAKSVVEAERLAPQLRPFLRSDC